MWFIELPDGTEYELSVAHGIALRGVQGNGMPPVNIISSEYGLADGALYQRTKTLPRVITFLIDAVGSSWDNLHAVRAALIEASNPHRGALPVRIWYRADSTAGHGLYLDAYYEAGLEGGRVDGFVEESIAFRFLALDPFWKYETATSGTLNVYDTLASANHIVSRDANGVWSNMGSGANSVVETVVEDANGNIYAGGSFTTIGGVSAAYVAKWNGTTWSALGTGLNNKCYTLAFGPDGTLYACGDFTTAGGVSANHIAKWNGTAWSALGTGLDADCYIIVFDTAGNLYAGGDFTTAGGISANRVAKWDGSSWSALGSGASSTVYSMDFDKAGNLYIWINTIGYHMWDGSSWIKIADTSYGYGYALRAMPNGSMLAAAGFVDGATTVCGLRKWDGTSWQTLYNGGDFWSIYQNQTNQALIT